MHHAPICQRNRFAGNQVSAVGPCRHSESLCRLDKKRALGFLLKHITETAAAAMENRKRVHLQVLFFDQLAWLDLDEFDLDVYFSAAQDDLHQIAHAV